LLSHINVNQDVRHAISVKIVRNELSLDEFDTINRNYARIKWLTLIGGEPFLRNDIVDIVQSFCSTNKLYVINIPTNGLRTDFIVEKTKEMLESFNLHNLILPVSIDGYESLNDEIRGVKGGFKSAFSTYIALRKLSEEFPHLKVYISFTISKFNVDSILKTFFDIRELYDDITFKDVHFNIFHSSSHYYNNDSERLDIFKFLEAIELINRMKGQDYPTR
jgi:MoaA/NifB/PqqE/SkfB family radical SAM enzyme